MKILSHRKSIMPYGISRTGNITSYPPHSHDFIELTYIHTGEGVHILNGERTHFRARDVLFTPPSMEHSFADAGTHDQTSIALYPEFFTAHSLAASAEALSAVVRSRKYTISLLPDQADDMERAIEIMFREYMFKQHRYERIIALTASHAIAVVERSLAEKRSTLSRFKDMPPPLYAALMKIESEYHMLGESTAVADDSAVSAKHLIRLFKKHLKVTPLQYLNRVRVEKCCELMSAKDIAVADAAYRTGFNDLANFNRLFKRFTGMTPTAFRTAVAQKKIAPSSMNRFGFPLRKITTNPLPLSPSKEERGAR